jgi:hypothetical protein
MAIQLNRKKIKINLKILTVTDNYYTIDLKAGIVFLNWFK